MRNYDLEFLKHFSMVIGFLALVTLGLIIGAYFLHGTLPPEAENDWVVVSANWVNPKTDDLDAVYENNYRACKNAIIAAMEGLPRKEAVFKAAREVSNPFYTPKKR